MGGRAVPDGLSQAEPVSRLGPSGFDPSRLGTCLWCGKQDTPVDVEMLCEMCTNGNPDDALPDITYRRELRTFEDATAILWRAVQRDELCDLTECVHKFGGNCHCMGTFLALGMDALNAAIATEARRAETTGSVHEGADPKGIAHE